ncbi:hypothetical protein TNCV_4746831 [Trichonephila clavipes]|nr:hypothetical protein TNCV_4746831 [Trichonephila clavipes]
MAILLVHWARTRDKASHGPIHIPPATTATDASRNKTVQQTDLREAGDNLERPSKGRLIFHYVRNGQQPNASTIHQLWRMKLVEIENGTISECASEI